MSEAPFPSGTFPPGSYPAQVQRLYENLPQRLQEAWRNSVVGQTPMSSEDQVAYDLLADLFSQIEDTNTWIERTLQQEPGTFYLQILERWRERLAEQKEEWEELTREPLKVIGTDS
jgi:hypothetical protein